MINKIKTRFLYNEDDGAGTGVVETPPAEGDTQQQEQPQVPAGVTREDLQEFAGVIAQSVQQAVTPQAPDEEEQGLPDDILYDKEKLEALIEARAQKHAQNAQNAVLAHLQALAPVMAQVQVEAIAGDLSPEAKNYVKNVLGKASPDLMQAAAQNPELRELVRNAAIGHSVLQSGQPIPKATPTPGAAPAQSIPDSQVQEVMRGFGLSREDAIKVIKGAA